MLKINIIVLLCAILALCESAAIIDKVNIKCKSDDSDCQQKLYRGILQEVSENGIAELGIPKVDPFEVKHMELSPLNMLKITVKDGSVKGFKSCASTTFKSHIETLSSEIVLLCDQIVIGGHFKLETLPAFSALAGGIDVHGEGTVNFTIDKLQLNLDLPFDVVKLDDGENHLRMRPEDATHTFDILDKATFEVNNIFVGKTDISAVTMSIFNEYWKFITKSMGNSILDIALEHYFENVKKFFDAVPVKDLIIDDLSAYIKS